jgi:hypothetical protein
MGFMKKAMYSKPVIKSEKSFETSALACGKTTSPPPGSWHTGSAYDTFTGHFGSGFGGSASVSGSAGIGFGPGGTSGSYVYSGMCGNWITYSS